MIRKKYFIQNDIMNKTARVEGTKANHNAKVTVQYIQDQAIQKRFDSNHQSRHVMPTVVQDDLEIENVEYLEETPNVEEYIEERCENYEQEDSFYPNAIYCLLDLYKKIYGSLNVEDGSMKVNRIWCYIAKKMQESFFEFNYRQIQQKYAQLRQQYFDVQTKDDVENFDYFEQLHDIYKDQNKENIVKELKGPKVGPIYYKDEILLQLDSVDNNEVGLHGFKSKEIVHKEHEFIDMVEKELQAMENSLKANVNSETAVGEINNDKLDNSKEGKQSNDEETTEEEKPLRLKRLQSNTETSREPHQNKKKISNEYFQVDNNFTLYHYNQEQERRHREKMSLLEKSLQIQEHALEQQQQLLQELIKRLPS